MRTRSYFTAMAALAILVTGTAIGSEKKGAEGEKGLKCPISGKPINKDVAADYEGGKVYFCCAGCPKKFADHAEKYAAKANHQMVATKQFKQKACPISGKACKDSIFAKVAGVKVHFCCPNCKGKVEKAKKDDQLKIVFAGKPFKKGFEKKKEKKGEKTS